MTGSMKSLVISPINFRHVHKNLYAGGQPVGHQWMWLKDFGIEYVISINESRDYSASAVGLQVSHHPIWDIEVETELKDPAILSYIERTLDKRLAQGRTYLHCISGVDRTGLVVARYRVRVQGWTKEQARLEWTAAGSNRRPGVLAAWREWLP